jgi:large subunit ribosomal protein L14
MKGLGSRITRGLSVGSRLVCNDNSGAKILQIIGVIGTKARHTRVPSAGISSIVICAVKKGNPSMKKKVVRVCIVRQRKEYRRPNGIRIRFEDNAGVLVDDDGLPVGTEIKGAIAREVAERYPKIAAIAAAVV